MFSCSSFVLSVLGDFTHFQLVPSSLWLQLLSSCLTQPSLYHIHCFLQPPLPLPLPPLLQTFSWLLCCFCCCWCHYYFCPCLLCHSCHYFCSDHHWCYGSVVIHFDPWIQLFMEIFHLCPLYKTSSLFLFCFQITSLNNDSLLFFDTSIHVHDQKLTCMQPFHESSHATLIKRQNHYPT